MAVTSLPAKAAREQLYEVMRSDAPFEEKAHQALELGVEFLNVDNGHFTQLDPETNHWEALVSTDPPDGEFPAGLELDLQTTYCRRTIDADGPIALHHASEQGWSDDKAYQTHGLECYHGTAMYVEDEPFGTICFVSHQQRSEPFSVTDTLFAELLTRLLERELERQAHQEALTRRANLVNVLNRVLRHNLRNDLAVIRGHAQLMADNLGPEHDCEPLFRKVDNLLDVSQKARRLESIVEHDATRQQTAIVPLIERVIDEIRTDYPSVTIEIDVTSSDESLLNVPVLPSFQRAVRELLENAAKHGGDPASVEVRIEPIPNAVAISIADDGPGLPKSEREVIRSGVETPLIHGSGIGLWLVHWIVTSHDGEVVATVDDGTTMTIELPRTPEPNIDTELIELQAARDRYQATFEEAYDAMAILDDDRRILDANAEAARIYDMERLELLGRPLDAFFPDDVDVDTAWEQFLENGKQRGTIPMVSAAGERREVEYAATAEVIPGQHLTIFREHTETFD